MAANKKLKYLTDELRENIRHITLMNNAFMNLCFNNNTSCVQAILRIILGRSDLIVKRVQTQKSFQGVIRSLVIDVYAEDKDGKRYNIEIQRTNKGASPERARYHGAVIDVYSLKKGQDFSELPECYIIFITENDVLNRDQTMYTIHKYIDGTNERFNDGQHIIYINCSAKDDGSDIWKVVHDMLCDDPDEMFIPELAARTKFVRGKVKGEENMESENFDEYLDNYIDNVVERKVAEATAESEARANAEAKSRARAEAKAKTESKARAKAESKAKEESKARAKAEAEAKAQTKALKDSMKNFALRLLDGSKMTLEEISKYSGLALSEVQALAEKS